MESPMNTPPFKIALLLYIPAVKQIKQGAEINSPLLPGKHS